MDDAVRYANKEYKTGANMAGHLVIYDLYLGSDQRGKEITLAWHINPKDGGRQYVIVDAYSGDVLIYDDGKRY